MLRSEYDSCSEMCVWCVYVCVGGWGGRGGGGQNRKFKTTLIVIVVIGMFVLDAFESGGF